jgi:hypothetical protein
MRGEAMKVEAVGAYEIVEQALRAQRCVVLDGGIATELPTATARTTSGCGASRRSRPRPTKWSACTADTPMLASRC